VEGGTTGVEDRQALRYVLVKAMKLAF